MWTGRIDRVALSLEINVLYRITDHRWWISSQCHDLNDFQMNVCFFSCATENDAENRNGWSSNVISRRRSQHAEIRSWRWTWELFSSHIILTLSIDIGKDPEFDAHWLQWRTLCRWKLFPTRRLCNLMRTRHAKPSARYVTTNVNLSLEDITFPPLGAARNRLDRCPSMISLDDVGSFSWRRYL